MMRLSYSHTFRSYYMLLLLCLISFDFNKTGCLSRELDEDLTSEASNTFMDTINTLKDKVKGSGIEKPDDIPLISDWKKKCESIVGKRKWRAIRAAPSRIIDCVSNYIEKDTLESEIKKSMEIGELDEVFIKYCGYQEQLMDCIYKELELVKPCLSEQQLSDLEILHSAVNASVDFICHENGNRIALFLAEEGIACLNQTMEGIGECITSKVPEIKDFAENPETVEMDQLVFNEDLCTKIAAIHDCIGEETTTCDDPTPNNLLDSLIKQARKETPCAYKDNASAQTYTPAASASAVFYLHFRALLPHVLTLIAAGLTAAHILL